jgi:regulator of protease activity HflC (stomatin/prohibitin superfamily)
MTDDNRGPKKRAQQTLTVAQAVRSLGFIGKAILALSVISAPFAAVFGVAIVDPGERGVYVRNGEVRGTVDNGVHPHIPLTDRIRTFDMRTAVFRTNASALTDDDINVEVAVTVRWDIRTQRLLHVYRNVAVSQEALVDKAVTDAVVSGIKTSRRFDAENLSSDEYRTAVKERIENRFEPRGLVLRSVTIDNIEYPPSVQKKFREQQESAAQKQIEQNKLEASRTRAERRIVEAKNRRRIIEIQSEPLTPEYIAYIRAKNIDSTDTVYVVSPESGISLEKSVDSSSGNTTARSGTGGGSAAEG